MLYTNYYYVCCRLFQTTSKNCKVPHLKSTDLNRIQVTAFTSLAATCKSNSTTAIYWLLPPVIVL